MMEKIVLTKFNHSTILERMNAFLDKPFELNGANYGYAEVRRHQLFGKKISLSHLVSKPVALLFVALGGSGGRPLCAGDIFTFNENSVLIKQPWLINREETSTILHFQKRKDLDNPQYLRAFEEEVKFQHQYAESYWRDVEREWEKEMEETWDF